MKSKLLALSKNEEFRKLLQQKKVSNKYVTIFFGYLNNKNENRLNISFITKKKIGNAVKRNKIKRRLRNIMNDACKKISINLKYSYLVIAKPTMLNNEFKIIKSIKAEFKYSDDTRFDFLCDKKILEVKNVTLLRDDNTAEFPDAVTSRGSKHLKMLINSIKKGYKPYVLFLTQIQDINKFRIAKDIDANYYTNYIEAKNAGVNFLAYRCYLNSKEIKVEKKINIINE